MCSMIVPLDKSGAPQPPKAEAIKTEIMCEKDGAPMLLRWSKRGPFLGCSSFPKCRATKMVSKLPEEQIKYIESLLPELRARWQKSFELAAKMTGREIESYGQLPNVTVNRAATDDAPKRKAPSRRAKAATPSE
jgi:ssDNA-binding Zn-finger/Zn-ribbon topoisomerase 1